MKDIALDYYDNVEKDEELIERFVLENEEKIRKMPEPQNGWIGRTNFGEWFIVIRQPDNNEYYTMVYEKGGFDRGALNESYYCFVYILIMILIVMVFATLMMGRQLIFL